MIWLLLRRFWPYLAGAALVSVAWYAIQAYGDRRYDAGVAKVRAEWNAAVIAANAAQREKEREARAHNETIREQYEADLVAIAGDRDSLAGRLREYEATLSALRMRAGTDNAVASVLTGIAARSAAVDAAFDAYDTACRLDAAQLAALIAQVKPQL